MNVLEKIIEEIRDNAEFGNMHWETVRIEKVIEIIRSHMNDETDTNVGSKSGWIPCSEILPEDNRMVLVTCQTKRGIRGVYRAYYDGMFWYGSGFMPRVIAWQPLPEPYKREEAAG